MDDVKYVVREKDGDYFRGFCRRKDADKKARIWSENGNTYQVLKLLDNGQEKLVKEFHYKPSETAKQWQKFREEVAKARGEDE